MDTVIKVESISKQYRLGQVGTGSLKDDFKRWRYRLMGKEDPFLKVGEVNDRTKKASTSDYVWALRNINFEVQRGDVLGIIGRNGAGKSTLLKILSRTTAPTTGSLKMKGRIASLLEVGTGFHPELSGRENIFLNGAIMGLRKYEIKNKLDEIIDFSGVERYLDTPVKRYSSGMYVRLAFAVAAHLEPEILIVDEVLAVGDAEFQKKCMGKMKDVGGEGRTVIFVSHNMAAVKTLCNNSILMNHGTISMIDQTDKVIARYLTGDSGNKHSKIFKVKNEIFDLTEINIYNQDKTDSNELEEKSPIVLNTKLFFHSELGHKYHLTYHLNNELGEELFSFGTDTNETPLQLGLNSLNCYFPADFFQSGQYFLSLFIVKDRREAIYFEKDIMSFTVVDSTRQLGTYMGREPGYIKPKFSWKNNNL